MATSRIPGPLCSIQGSGIAANTPHPVGTAAPPAKVVPVAVQHCIYYPPPRLLQGDLYKGKEGRYACWATVSEMIVKWRNEKAPFARPKFAHMIEEEDDIERKVAYMDYVRKTVEGFGFQLVPGAGLLTWDTTLLASSLNSWGPLYCVGSFWVDGQHNLAVGGIQHAIAVFGAQDDIVYYRDPWDGEIKTMSTGEFSRKLLRSSTANMYRYTKHQRH